MWDELVNSFDLTVTKEDIKRYNEMKKKGAVKMTVQEALARLQRIVGEYENLTDEIKKEIRKAKKELKKVCKREPKTKEEATFFVVRGNQTRRKDKSFKRDIKRGKKRWKWR